MTSKLIRQRSRFQVFEGSQEKRGHYFLVARVWDTHFTFGGPGLARNPDAAMRTMQRQFDKHSKQVHMREEPAKLLCGS